MNRRWFGMAQVEREVLTESILPVTRLWDHGPSRHILMPHVDEFCPWDDCHHDPILKNRANNRRGNRHSLTAPIPRSAYYKEG